MCDDVSSISNNLQFDIYSKLKYLRMLSFCGCELTELTDKIGNLKLLRYLDVTSTQIKSLPNSICELYNLETLILENCSELTELPLDFCKLVCLRHLYLEGTGIKKMPKKIGRLNHLQTLSHFIVGENSGSDIKELDNLNLLRGGLCISGLEHVINPVDAAEANLKNKKYLEKLTMIYSYSSKVNYDGSELDVLEALQPNSNLKELTIKNYNGDHFPIWLRDCDLPNLVSLTLKNCGLCSHLPSLVQFHSLQKLEIRDCNKLEECLCIEGSPLLKELYISNCSKLKRVPLPQHLPSLQILKICNCEMMEISIPKGDSMIELVLQRCHRILVNEFPTSLKKFVFWGNRYAEFSEEQNLVNCTILEKLEFDFRGFVKGPSLDLRCYNSLCELSITGWDSSSSLPFSLHLFTNLDSLKLYDCPQLESFPRGGLPSNLRSLTIWNCPKVIGSREEWGLFQLNSLETFMVSDHEFENVESFPEENLLPPTLEYLQLRNCSKLRIMNNKGFLHLNSLQSLIILNCPSLESLPEEGLLVSSLDYLSIDECPLIREKYKKEGGERWHTISHIPEVYGL